MSSKGTNSNLVYIHNVYAGISDTVATAAEKVVECAGAKGISLSMKAASVGDSRAMTLTIQVSNDGVNYVGYNMLIDNLTNSNSQALTRVASKVRNANGTDILWFTPETLGGITHFKVKAERTTAGSAGTFDINACVIF